MSKKGRNEEGRRAKKRERERGREGKGRREVEVERERNEELGEKVKCKIVL